VSEWLNPDLLEWLQGNWIALVALVVSLASLSLGAFNTHLNWREKRRLFKVRLSWTHMHDSAGNRLSDDFLEVRVKNKGCAVQITSVAYQVLGVGCYQLSHPNAELRARESHVFTERADSLADAIRHAGNVRDGVIKIAAIVTETGGKRWTSNAVPFNMNKLLARYEERAMAEAKSAAELEAGL
jgi:hypothetical protein